VTRVLVVSDVSGWMAGGVPAETRHLLEGLVARGHAVGYAGDVALGVDDVAHHVIDVPTHADLPAQIEAALGAFAPDVVHVMAMGSRGLARIAPSLASHAWLCTVHSIPPHERKLARLHGHERLHYMARALRFAPNALAWRWLFRRGTMPHVVVHSAFVRDVALRDGIDPARVSVIPLGADLPSQPALGARDPGPAPRLVTVAGLAHTKGQHDLISALPAIAERHPGVTCRMIGEVRDRSYVTHCEHLADRLGVAERIGRVEGLSREALAAALREADVYVQPSHEEGFCLAFIEAASAVPRLVGTETGAIALIAEGDPDMRVVPPRAPSALAHAVLELLGRRPDAAALERRRARVAARFAWSRYLDAHEALYARLHARAASERT
jgi:glycosyltransferase involved in cell wall biosynthesis